MYLQQEKCHAANRRLSLHEACLLNLQEVSLIGLLAYLSYLAGDWLGLSGIVALFCCAVTISHYALHNVSSMSRVTTISAFQTLSYVSEGAIFIYVGMDTLDPLKWQVGSTRHSQATQMAPSPPVHGPRDIHLHLGKQKPSSGTWAAVNVRPLNIV